MLLVASVFLAISIFPVKEERELYWELYSRDWSKLNYDYESVVLQRASEARVSEFKEMVAKAEARNYPPPSRSLSLSPSRFTVEEIQLNTVMYQIAQFAMDHEAAVNFNNNPLADPLFLLANAVTEFGMVLDTNKFALLAPALPVRYLDKSMITEQYLQSFNTAEALKTSVDLAANRLLGRRDNQYSGPHQMSSSYGTGGLTMFLPDLMYESEYLALSADLEAYNIASNDSHVIQNRIQKYPGDRFNWNDSCIRTISNWNVDYGNLSNTKFSMITDQYMFMAILGLNHNIGTSVMSSDLTRVSGNFLKGINGSQETILDIWNYAKWVSSTQVIEELSRIADSSIARDNYNYTLPSSELQRIFNSYGSNMEPSTRMVLESYTNWHSQEPPLHAIRMLYNYIVLDKLYGGG
jgi:hypothetical protein